MWGAVGGLAAGLGLAALFSHLGLGEEMASFFLIALLVFAAVMIFRRLTGGAQASPQRMAYAGMEPPQGQPQSPVVTDGAISGEHFDEAAFSRQARLNFIRLQTAYDEGNLEDIRSFTSPEVFAEVRMQYEERGGATQKTDVVQLEAEVIEVAREGQRYVVSVRFNGLIREEADAPPAAFDEIWHLTKPIEGDAGWVVSGIQQSH